MNAYPKLSKALIVEAVFDIRCRLPKSSPDVLKKWALVCKLITRIFARHAGSIGWSSEKDAQKSRAQQLSAVAKLVTYQWPIRRD
jgi:hypothetical protein